jgi:hypothetical protein
MAGEGAACRRTETARSNATLQPHTVRKSNFPTDAGDIGTLWRISCESRLLEVRESRLGLQLTIQHAPEFQQGAEDIAITTNILYSTRRTHHLR